VHFAEEWNELHHLLIMESMGGNKRWRDRFLAQHAAVFYYWQGFQVSFPLLPDVQDNACRAASSVAHPENLYPVTVS
jgi:hypothetical protein